jgi:predicted O-methyltransferase YrrM
MRSSEVKAVEKGGSRRLDRLEPGLKLSDIFYSEKLEKEWHDAEPRLSICEIPDGTGGVNPGDRRALFYLTRALNAHSVLEIGTKIGASTTHIAAALHLNQSSGAGSCNLTTVDLRDMNDTNLKLWLDFNARYSPLVMMKMLGFEQSVEFVNEESLAYMKRCNGIFDIIFIDGSHHEQIVYQEVPVALSLLRDGGIIMLHDYFPDLKPLWSNNSVIKGPYLAIRRLINEGLDVTVRPLGRLPWSTKLGSNSTSLAVLYGSRHCASDLCS